MKTKKIIVSEEVKISNGLLNSVLGCECEFKGFYKNNIKLDCGNIVKMSKNDDIYIEPIDFYWIINLDTFIRLGIEKWIEEQRAYMLEFKKIDDGYGWFYDCIGDTVNKFENNFKAKQDAEMAFLEYVNNSTFVEKLMSNCAKFHPST